jgi:hypothetical protein
LETGPGKLDTDDALAAGQGLSDVDDAALGLEFAFGTTRDLTLRGDANLKMGTNGDIETRAKCGATAANIFAGGVFFEGETTRVAAANA